MAQTLSAMSRPAICSSATRRANTEHTDWGSLMRPPRASISSSLSLVDPSSLSAGLELPFATAEVLGLGIDRGGGTLGAAVVTLPARAFVIADFWRRNVGVRHFVVPVLIVSRVDSVNLHVGGGLRMPPLPPCACARSGPLAASLWASGPAALSTRSR